jgi:3-oxoadipate enol-lactonase
VPAANTGVAIATRLLRELEQAPVPQSAMTAAHPGTGASRRTASEPALHYTVREPRDAAGSPRTIVMSHALGCDLSMWDCLANALAARHRVICFDHRGHGLSAAPAGPYSMEMLSDDAARVLRDAGCGPVVWLGLSMGGMVGQELALRHPESVQALIIANSTSSYDDAARAMWQQRVDAIGSGGLEPIADGAMQRWFSEAFHKAQPAEVARWRRRVVTTSQAGYVAGCQAIMHMDTTARLAQIGVPTLVIAGALDQGTPPAMSRAIVAGIAGAKLHVIDEAAHLSVLEKPAEFGAAVNRFIDSL